MQLLGEFRLHAFLHNRRIIAIAHHVEIAVAEQVEAAAEYGGIGEFVLAEHVDGLVGDDRAGEQQAIPRLRAQPVQRLAGGDVVGFDLVTLVADDAIRPPRGQLLFQAPCAFIVHNQYLQRRAGHVPDGVRLPRARTLQHGERIVVIREFAEFILPHAENGQRRDHQQPLNALLLPETAHDGNGGERLARAHFHEQRGPAAIGQPVQRIRGGLLLVPVGRGPNGQLEIVTAH